MFDKLQRLWWDNKQLWSLRTDCYNLEIRSKAFTCCFTEHLNQGHLSTWIKRESNKSSSSKRIALMSLQQGDPSSVSGSETLFRASCQ